ncbi:MAG: ATP-binding cassette domain-containing protein [Methanomicrobiales archaeon]|nr:ATP-binding cassette domain-containing protein [Methanomicrobiales archaeon]
MHLIETRNLTYVYPGNVTALHDINFIAPRKARIAVIGSNGAGKSTLFKCFNGIFTPSSGSVLIRGEPITKRNIREVRKFVGIVFQNADDQIFSPTVEQDVAFGPINLGLDEETIHHRVSEAMRLVGIEDLADRVPHHLSSGEKKRVAMAGIIAMEPEVLVLDEPTAGLDPQGVRDLLDIINSLTMKFGMTVIFSTHDVSLVPEVAEYLYVMNRGRFVAQGTVEEIFCQPEMLQSVRLDVPVLPKLIRNLQKRDIPLPMAYRFDEVEQVLYQAYREKRP